MTSQSPSDMLTQAQKAKGKKMVKDINTWWKTVSKVGLLIHGNEEYYSLNPKNWSYPPDYLLSNNDKYDFKMLEDNWKDSKEDYEHAKYILKEYKEREKKLKKKTVKKKTVKKTEKKKTVKKKTVKKQRCPNGTRRNKKTGKCEKKK